MDSGGCCASVGYGRCSSFAPVMFACGDKVDHTVLIHVVVGVFVYFYTDTDELFVSCISDLISMLVECLDNCIPFVDVVGWTKSSEVITVCDDNHWFARVRPLEEQFEIPWCVLVSKLPKAFVELDGEVLSGWRESIQVSYCL